MQNWKLTLILLNCHL